MKFIAERIEQECNENGLDAAQEKYRKYFIYIKTYEAYREATDVMLREHGYAACIVA